MKAIDFRNETFEAVRRRADGMRERVYRAYLNHGAMTTMRCAEVMGVSVLSVRPRVTELLEVGALRLASHQDVKGEGVYEGRSLEEWEVWVNERRAGAVDGQLKMAI